MANDPHSQRHLRVVDSSHRASHVLGGLDAERALMDDASNHRVPAVTDLADFHSSWDEANLVTFPVTSERGSAQRALTLTSQRLMVGSRAVHLVNITGIAFSGDVLRSEMGALPRRYLLEVEEGARLHLFSFCDTFADRHVTRAGYTALVSHLRQGVLPSVQSELERRVERGETVIIGDLQVSSAGLGVTGGLPMFGWHDYAGCMLQDQTILVRLGRGGDADVTVPVALSAMNGQVLVDFLDAVADIADTTA